LIQNSGVINGGDGSFTYLWVKDTLAFPAAPGPNTILQTDYLPPNLKWKVSFKRTVKSSVCRDTSNSVKIIVDAPVTNTITLANVALDTIYSGQAPGQITGSSPTGGSGIAGDYSYKWYKSITGGPLKSEWTEIPGSILINISPGTLAQTTWFRRDVSSPSVAIRATYQSNKIKVVVLPAILNFDITASQSICSGKRPLILTGSVLSGGDGKYKFTWQDSTLLHAWQDISGFVKGDSANYKPSVLTSDAKYRRIVFSGKNYCGSETSKSVNIKVNTLPTGSITTNADTALCEGSKVRLKFHLTGASPWQVIYKENTTQNTLSNISGTDPVILVGPVTTAALATFNYSLFEVKDQNNCIATSLSGTRKADVYKVPVANAGPAADTVCGPTVSLTAIPSVGTGTWTYPTAVVTSTPNNTSVTLSIDSLYAGRNITHKFIWKELNWQCASKDSIYITFDKRAGPVNAGNDTTLFSFDNIFHTVADPVLVGSGEWSVLEGSGDFDDPYSNATVIKNMASDFNRYLWKVTNNLCSGEDIVQVRVVDIFVPQGFSPNGDDVNNTFIITGLDLPNQNAEFKVLNGAGAEVFSTSNINGQVWTDWDGKNSKGLDLSEGTYYYLLKLTSAGDAGTGTVFKKSGFIIIKRY
jgi:hypothetical protein